MKNRRKKTWRSILSAVLAASFLASFPGFGAMAAEMNVAGNGSVQLEPAGQEETKLGNPMSRIQVHNLCISFASHEDGLYVSMTSEVERPAAVIGVKDIVVEEKKLLWWSPVYEPMGSSIYRTTIFLGSFTYKDAVFNKKYRVSCTFYANADTYSEASMTSGEYTYIYRK